MVSSTQDERLAYTLDEAEAVLRVSRTTVFRQIKSGALKARRIGRRVIITREAMEAYLRGDDLSGEA